MTRLARIELTVVVPVYNNAAALAALCHQLKEALQTGGISFELLFVNDGSKDDSWQRLSDLAKRHPEITIRVD
jgi:glycosyltransferase involved in cell wall biosynthesis